MFIAEFLTSNPATKSAIIGCAVVSVAALGFVKYVASRFVFSLSFLPPTATEPRMAKIVTHGMFTVRKWLTRKLPSNVLSVSGSPAHHGSAEFVALPQTKRRPLDVVQGWRRYCLLWARSWVWFAVALEVERCCYDCFAEPEIHTSVLYSRLQERGIPGGVWSNVLRSSVVGCCIWKWNVSGSRPRVFSQCRTSMDGTEQTRLMRETLAVIFAHENFSKYEQDNSCMNSFPKLS